MKFKIGILLILIAGSGTARDKNPITKNASSNILVEQYNTISGKVFNLDGQPIRDAAVYARGYSMNSYPEITIDFFDSDQTCRTSTKIDGSFLLQIDNTMRYFLLFTKDGHAPFIRYSHPGQFLLIALSPCVDPIIGYVIDASSKLPLEGIKLEVNYYGGNKDFCPSETDKGGMFQLSNMPPLIDYIFFTKEGYDTLRLGALPTKNLNGRIWELTPVQLREADFVCRSSIDRQLLHEVQINDEKSIADSKGRHKLALTLVKVRDDQLDDKIVIKAEGYSPFQMRSSKFGQYQTEGGLAAGKTTEVELSPAITGWGRLVDKDQNPVSGVTVNVVMQEIPPYTLWEHIYCSALSNRGGMFSFDYLPIDTSLDLTFCSQVCPWQRSTGHAVPKRSLDSGQYFLGNFVIQRFGQLTGIVADEEGNPIPGCVVALNRPHVLYKKGRDGAKEKYFQKLTDEFGRYFFSVDKYDCIKFSKPGYLTHADYGLIEILPNENLFRPVVELQKSAYITGKVLDTKKKPVPGAILYSREVSEPNLPTRAGGTKLLWPESRTNFIADSNGTFFLDGLKPGKYYYIGAFRAAPTLFDSEPFKILKASAENITVQVFETAHIVLELKDTNGVPVINSNLSLRLTNSTQDITCSSGFFSARLPIGKLGATVSANGYQEKSMLLFLTPGNTKEHLVTLLSTEDKGE